MDTQIHPSGWSVIPPWMDTQALSSISTQSHPLDGHSHATRMGTVTPPWVNTEAYPPGWAFSHTVWMDTVTHPRMVKVTPPLGKHTGTISWMGIQSHPPGWTITSFRVDPQSHLLDGHTFTSAGWAHSHTSLDGHIVTPSWVVTVTLPWMDTKAHPFWMSSQLHPLDGQTVTPPGWSQSHIP